MSQVITVVDNDESIRDIFASLAHEVGWTYFGYSYSEVSLASLQQHTSDLIVLDFNQDKMGEGWEFLQLLKMESITASIPIVVSTTGRVLSQETQVYLASRNIAVIPKPFDIENFIAIARQIFIGQRNLLLSPTVKLPILLADDNEALSSQFIEILQFEGYLATHVPNGSLALDAARQEQHSLIFLDINMPVMTGHEFLSAYALLPVQHTPVIMFTSESGLSIKKLPYFVVGQLPKIFQVKELIALVNKFAQPT